MGNSIGAFMNVIGALRSGDADFSLCLSREEPPPSVKSEFSDYVCLTTDDKPWAQPYDMNRDGAFGVDDMKAFLTHSRSIENNQDSLDSACLGARIAFLGREVEWKLKELLSRTPQDSAGVARDIQRAEQITGEALRSLDVLANDDDKRSWAITIGTRSRITEMSLRSLSLLRGSEDEPFGVGMGLVSVTVLGNMALRVSEVHPASAAAAAGLRVGDFVTAVEGVPVDELSDSNGLKDERTQLVRGFAGARDSEVQFTVYSCSGPHAGRREFAVPRNIWSARTLGAPRLGEPWDGREK
jgi:hypothetical protein